LSLITQGFVVMFMGLAGVFAVLIIFYVLTKLMLMFSKRYGKPS
jgi:Na+-transporting methylmalonyl-CoA/oxaloacetate decarboxylase gamma subunit